ncbi:UNVERIFIED_CONTAM: NPC intracellular cholesterol transporter 1 [Sesamum angustifolium]|uniref:NPC intracellular cholesterol transporter 1 n=1 Tax=Sesamum angustifolium TaxID=2727405 RepID=A0AAW2L6Y4_9LAMI
MYMLSIASNGLLAEEENEGLPAFCVYGELLESCVSGVFVVVVVAAAMVNGERSDTRFLLTSNDTGGQRHSEDYCAMYDICGARSDGKVLNCPVGSPAVKYFKMDQQNYDSFGGLDHVEYCFQHYTSADTCASAFKAPLDPSTALGGFSGNNYTEASAFIVTYPVNNEIDEEGNGTKRAVAWEKAFIQLAKEELLPMVQSRNLTLAFSSESSVEEELKRESTADAITILCFRHSELQNDRPSTEQFREKLPWFLSALPSADCAKGGNGAYTSSVELKGYEDGIIRASAFRTYHTPLNKQIDYVNSMRAARDFSSKMSESLKYLNIWKTALINLAIAIGAVFVVCLVITCSFWTSAIILLVLAMIVVDLLGIMAILNIQLNALSVVNLVMSVGIAVEFCVHITHAFLVSSGDRNQRMKEALTTMGASVFSGITLTKLVGVLVLCFSRTEVFVVYYFKMYLSLVLLGFLHGLVFLPVILSMFGPPSRCVLIEKQDDRPSTSSQF